MPCGLLNPRLFPTTLSNDCTLFERADALVTEEVADTLRSSLGTAERAAEGETDGDVPESEHESELDGASVAMVDNSSIYNVWMCEQRLVLMATLSAGSLIDNLTVQIRT